MPDISGETSLDAWIAEDLRKSMAAGIPIVGIAHAAREFLKPVQRQVEEILYTEFRLDRWATGPDTSTIGED